MVYFKADVIIDLALANKIKLKEWGYKKIYIIETTMLTKN